MTKNELILSVAHNIFLTEKERYMLVDGEAITIIGVSIPVWFYQGSTSEPAVEVFGKYTITNNKNKEFIEATPEGYHINLPQIPENYEPPKRFSNDEWRKLSRVDQEKWYENNEVPPSAKNLRNVGDGGGAYMRFQERIQMKREGRPVLIAHYVEIKTIEELIESLES